MSDVTQTAVGLITWHELLAADKDLQVKFYADLLGWEIEIFKPGEFDYPMVKKDGQTHGGFLQLEQEGVPSFWVAYVETGDAGSLAERVKSLGGKIIVDPRPIPEVGTFTMLSDPHGGTIAAIQPVSDGPLAEGAFVWDEALTPDVDGAKRFYSELFGWTAEDVEMEGGPPYTLFKVGDRNVAGCMKPSEDMPMAVWQTYIGVDDVDAITARGRELGAEVLMEPMEIPDIGRFASLRDPLGAVFGLFRPHGM